MFKMKFWNYFWNEILKLFLKSNFEIIFEKAVSIKHYKNKINKNIFVIG